MLGFGLYVFPCKHQLITGKDTYQFSSYWLSQCERRLKVNGGLGVLGSAHTPIKANPGFAWVSETPR